VCELNVCCACIVRVHMGALMEQGNTPAQQAHATPERIARLATHGAMLASTPALLMGLVQG